MIFEFLALAAVQQQPAPSPPPPPCATEAHGAFDFWVGDWDVYGAANPEQKVADSKIEKLYNGCGIRENWMPASGADGGSLTSLAADGLWHQRWVGSGGGIVDFVGGSPSDGVMILTGHWPGGAGPNTLPLIRMTYTLNQDGSVRQHGEQSLDHGATWTNSFDFTYRPKSAS